MVDSETKAGELQLLDPHFNHWLQRCSPHPSIPNTWQVVHNVIMTSSYCTFTSQRRLPVMAKTIQVSRDDWHLSVSSAELLTASCRSGSRSWTEWPPAHSSCCRNWQNLQTFIVQCCSLGACYCRPRFGFEFGWRQEGGDVFSHSLPLFLLPFLYLLLCPSQPARDRVWVYGALFGAFRTKNNTFHSINFAWIFV